MPTISYAVTAYDEHSELERLLEQLRAVVRAGDEIVVQLDATATTEVHAVVRRFLLEPIVFGLNHDFARFRNHLKKRCSAEYVFYLDADEYLSPVLAESLAEALVRAPDYDVLAIPRVNTVTGLTPEHVAHWQWKLNEQGWINWPDYQTRICRNLPAIHWEHKVHEQLAGWKNFAKLPADNTDWALFHPKDIARQTQQIRFYESLT